MFDHKDKLCRMELENRRVLLQQVQTSIQEREKMVKAQGNFKHFYVSPRMQMYGFATLDQIEHAKTQELLSLRYKNRLTMKQDSFMPPSMSAHMN